MRDEALENILNDKAQFEALHEHFSREVQHKMQAIDGNFITKFENWRDIQEFDMRIQTVVKAEARPVTFIQNNIIGKPQLKMWQELLEANNKKLHSVVPGCGVIICPDHPKGPFMGSAWLIGENVLITNRHVAENFIESSISGTQLTYSVVFERYQEYETDNTSKISFESVLHIDTEIDMALFKLNTTDYSGNKLPEKLELDNEDPEHGTAVAVIGYPSEDYQEVKREEVRKLFKETFDVKRFQPGFVIHPLDDDSYFKHDCSTLAGNSGSAVIRFATGKVVGLHYSSRYKRFNFAAKASYIRNAIKLANSPLLA